MALPLDVFDPGSVNVEAQGYGQGVPANIVNPAIDGKSQSVAYQSQPLAVGVAQTIAAGSAQPGNANTITRHTPGILGEGSTAVEYRGTNVGSGVIPTIAAGSVQPGNANIINRTNPGRIGNGSQSIEYQDQPTGTGLPKNVFI